MDDIERRIIHLESTRDSIGKLEDSVAALAIKVDHLLTATAALDTFKNMHNTSQVEIAKVEESLNEMRRDMNQLSRDLLSKWSTARGIILAGTVFFTILQGMLAVMWMNVTNMVEYDHEKIIEIQQRHRIQDDTVDSGLKRQ